jgi:exopolyphosphatase/guanosine-5'-triphosphate,3'-diphosphate pyrophosphatase
VRLTERFLHGDPPTDAELAAATAALVELLPALDVESAVGVAGTVGQLAALAERTTLARADVERLTGELAALPLERRRRLPRLDPSRAPVIVAGALIVRDVLRHYGLDGIEFSVRDLLDGAALEAAALPSAPEATGPPGAYTCC